MCVGGGGGGGCSGDGDGGNKCGGCCNVCMINLCDIGSSCVGCGDVDRDSFIYLILVFVM